MAFKKIFGRKARPLSAMPSSDTDNMNGCFECNICLESVRDPVVTLCGHLYCWPCLHKWFTIQSTSLASDEHPQCPVCKTEVSQSTLIPLYGRGETANGSGHNEAATSHSVPPRPPAHHAARELVDPTSQPRQQIPFQNPDQYYSPYGDGIQSPSTSSPLFNQGRSQPVNVVHPVLEMFAEMIYARMSGNSSRNLYSLQNSYHSAMNPRLRRQELKANKFLSRISLFFLCCILMCLVLF